jgi:hypothetical protein
VLCLSLTLALPTAAGSLAFGCLEHATPSPSHCMLVPRAWSPSLPALTPNPLTRAFLPISVVTHPSFLLGPGYVGRGSARAPFEGFCRSDSPSLVSMGVLAHRGCLPCMFHTTLSRKH